MTGEREMMQFESDHGRVEVYERPPTSSQPVDMSLCRYPNIKTKRKRAPKKEKKKQKRTQKQDQEGTHPR